MIERDILQAFQQSVIAAVAASTVPTLPIKFIGVSFIVPNDQKYLEIVHIPNNGADVCWGDEERYRGLFRLILHWPNNNAGAYTPMNLRASILSGYTKHQKIGGLITLMNKPKATSSLEQGTEIMYPASLEYSVFALAS